MKPQSAAVLAIVSVVGGVGWRLAQQPEPSARLQDIRLVPESEHSQPGPSEALAGVRIRLSPSDFGYDVRAGDHDVPQIPVAGD